MSVAHDRFDATETFQLAIEASPTGVLVTDAAGTIQLVNTELERQFGYTREELVGQQRRPAGARSPAARSPGPPPELRRRLRSRGRWAPVLELFGRRKDGSAIAVEIGLKPIQTADGQFRARDGRGRQRAPADAGRATFGDRGATRIRTVCRRAFLSVHQHSGQRGHRGHSVRSPPNQSRVQSRPGRVFEDQPGWHPVRGDMDGAWHSVGRAALVGNDTLPMGDRASNCR